MNPLTTEGEALNKETNSDNSKKNTFLIEEMKLRKTIEKIQETDPFVYSPFIEPSKTTIIPILKKFIYVMKRTASFYKFQNLNDYGFSLLNDKSYFPLKIEKKTILNNRAPKRVERYYIEIKRIFQEIEVFHPYNTVKIIWEIVHFFIILLLMFLIPINCCFFMNLEEDLKVFFIIFFLGDIVMNLNTSYFQKGFIVKKRKNIMIHYLRSEFFIDVLTLAVYLIDYNDYGHYNFFKLIFLMRWSKLEKISLKVQEKFKIGLKVHTSVIDLINLLFFSFYILNIFACFWYYIGFINENKHDGNTWMKANNLTNESLLNKYFYSFYWSTVTIMTVGYGDISATNIAEAIYSSFAIFFGCGLFAYFINSIGSIVQDINKESHNFKTKMAVINQYMERKHIDHNLQMKIREYLRFIWQEESTQNSEIETEIINKLSKSLKSELVFDSYGQIFKNSPMFFANFSKRFLSELMNEIKEVRNIPEDSIFSKEQTDDCEIYFIIKGKVELYKKTHENKEENNKLIKVLKDGDSFGEIAFFTGLSRNCYAKSIDFTTLFLLKRKDLLDVLSRHPEDYEKYCMIRDQILFQNKMSSLQIKCFVCTSKDHHSVVCPLIHFVPNRLKIIKRYVKDPGQKERHTYNRLRPYKYNSLAALTYTNQCNEIYRKYELDSETNSLQNIEEENLFEKTKKSPFKTNITLELKKDLSTLPKVVSIEELEENSIDSSNSSEKFEDKDEENLNESLDKDLNEKANEDYIKRDNLGLDLSDFKKFTEKQEEVKKYPGFFSNLKHYTTKPGDFNIKTTIKKNKFFESPPTIKITHAEAFSSKLEDIESYNPIHHELKDNEPLRKPIAGENLPKSINKVRHSIDSNFELRPIAQSSRKSESNIFNILNQRKKSSIFGIFDQKNDLRKFGNAILPPTNPNNRKASKANEEKDSDRLDWDETNFEKGADFKNYFPNSNLTKMMPLYKENHNLIIKNLDYKFKIMLPRRKTRKTRVLPITDSEERNSCSLKSEIFKKETFSRIENLKPFTRFDTLKQGLSRNDIMKNIEKKNSNIFMKKQENFFDQKNKYTFYDVVEEVLYNEDLRKKLLAFKKKFARKNHKKKFFN